MEEIIGGLSIGRVEVDTQDYAEDNWTLPFEGKVVEPRLDDIARALPASFTVTAVQNSRDSLMDKTKDAFTWTDGEHMFATRYWGDSIYYTTVLLDDGFWAEVYVDAINARGNFGDTLCRLVIEAMRTENQYSHVLSFDVYGNENVERGERILEKVSLEELLCEKGEIEARLHRAERLLNDAANKSIWKNYISHCLEQLDKKEAEIARKQA